MIRYFIIKNLLSLHSGTAANKIISAIKLTAVPAVGFTISEKLSGWYVDSQSFIFLLVGVLFVDLVLGIWKHLKRSTFSFKQMILGFTQKLWIVVFFYFLSEVIIQIFSDVDLDSAYIRAPLRLMIFIYPAGNALVNMGIITDGKFPPLAFLKKIEKFNKTLDINDLNLKNNKDESENSITNSPE